MWQFLTGSGSEHLFIEIPSKYVFPCFYLAAREKLLSIYAISNIMHSPYRTCFKSITLGPSELLDNKLFFKCFQNGKFTFTEALNCNNSFPQFSVIIRKTNQFNFLNAKPRSVSWATIDTHPIIVYYPRVLYRYKYWKWISRWKWTCFLSKKPIIEWTQRKNYTIARKTVICINSTHTIVRPQKHRRGYNILLHQTATGESKFLLWCYFANREKLNWFAFQVLRRLVKIR